MKKLFLALSPKLNALCAKLLALNFMLFVVSGNGQEIESIYYETWSNNTWQPSMTYDYSYDDNLFLINTLTRFYSSGNWANYTQTNYSNNDNGSIHFYVTQLWDQQGGSWDNSQKATYSYTESDKPLQIIYQSWTAGTWQNSMNYIYNYDDNDLVIKLDIMMWNTSSLSWQTSARYFYNNNPDSTIHDYLYQTYDAGGGGWSNQNRGTYSYSDTKQLLTSFIEVWTNGNWQNSMLLTNEYDQNDYLVYNLTQLWSQMAGAWQNNSQTNYNNNDDGTVHQFVLQTWQSNSWHNSTRATYSYMPGTGTFEVAVPEIRIYPNPVKNSFRLYSAEFRDARLTICDLYGKQLMELSGIDNNENINVSNLSTGFYLLILDKSNQKFSLPLIKY